MILYHGSNTMIDVIDLTKSKRPTSRRHDYFLYGTV